MFLGVEGHAVQRARAEQGAYLSTFSRPHLTTQKKEITQNHSHKHVDTNLEHAVQRSCGHVLRVCSDITRRNRVGVGFDASGPEQDTWSFIQMTITCAVREGLRAILSPAAILNVPLFYASIEGGGSKMTVFKKDTARDPITAAHQWFHFLIADIKIFIKYEQRE